MGGKEGQGGKLIRLSHAPSPLRSLQAEKGGEGEGPGLVRSGWKKIPFPLHKAERLVSIVYPHPAQGPMLRPGVPGNPILGLW